MKNWKFVVACVAVFVASGFFYMNCTTVVERPLAMPPSPEARANPLLAAERFLTKMGLPADSSDSLDDLPPPDHVLVLGTDTRFVRDGQAAQIHHWIEAGGHLIVGPHLAGGELTSETRNDPLLGILGVGVVDLGEPEEEPRTPVEFDPLGTGNQHEVRYFDRVALTWRHREEEDADGAYAHLSGTAGDGRFDVVNDTGFMHNDQVGDLDHAAFLWELVGIAGPRRGATLVYDARTTGWKTLVWRHGRWSLLLAGLALAALVWRHVPRFGPPLTRHDPLPRSLMEHVTAAGRFFWRTRRQDVLLEEARQAVLRRAEVRRPRFAESNRTVQSQMLAAAAGLSDRDVEAALFETCPYRRETFTRWIQILEQLRRGL